MKQKYTILKDDEKNELKIREFAELNKEMLTFLCEETYDQEHIKSAIEQGRPSLITALRTQNMYPPVLYADKIAESVMEMYASEGEQSLDLFFDDLAFITKEQELQDVIEDLEDDADDIDDLLEDDIESDFDDKTTIDPINSPLKIADDESLDIEED